MSNWKAGDIAIYDGPVRSERALAVGLIRTGDEVTLLAREFLRGKYWWSIALTGPNGETVYVEEKYLKRKKPPASPFSFNEIISMCNDKSITDTRPTETQVRESHKGILQPFYTASDTGRGDG